MNHAYYGATAATAYPVCVLVPQIRTDEIEKIYLATGINKDDVLILDLHQSATKKKTPMAEMVSYFMSEIVPVLQDFSVQYLMVGDADYFKALTKSGKVEVHLGYVLDCAFGPWKVVYVPNYRTVFYDPGKIKAKVALGVEALLQHRLGNYKAPGADIIKFAAYPTSPKDIEDWLERLIVEDRPLTCDIETFSLKHNSAGIGTITFCWSKHEGIAFPVDYSPIPGATEAPFGQQIRNDRVRKALLNFFLRFPQKLIYHSIGYDVYVLIYQLFMKDILDTAGLLRGMKVMLNNWDCTKLIAYLATNSCSGNELGLKVLSQEFSGNYSVEEIKDICRIPQAELLQYNLIDGLSTWFVHEKYRPIMIADQQLPIYEELFQPAQLDIIQMQLTGMPVDMDRVAEVKLILQADEAKALKVLQNSKLVQHYTYKLREKHVRERNAELKKKQISLTDAETLAVEFNPNSAPQLQSFLYGFLGLPVIALSKAKLPSTKGKVIKSLINHTKDPDVIDALKSLVDYKAVNKILNDFIPSLEGAVKGPDGWHYLFGNFNLGGTLSGRLSSSGPNLQNLPATGSRYAKLIKSCFRAPPGWLFCGLDFASLEDKISGLTTKDPNKLKVYTDGFDGHSLRAYAYFRPEMPDILQSDGRRMFTVTQDGKQHLLFEGDQVIQPDGTTVNIEDIQP